MKKQIISLINFNLKIDVEENPKSRKRELVYARAIYFRLMRDNTVQGLEMIGRPFKKDHACVIHAINKTFEEIKVYAPEIYDAYLEIKSILKYEKGIVATNVNLLTYGIKF